MMMGLAALHPWTTGSPLGIPVSNLGHGVDTVQPSLVPVSSAQRARAWTRIQRCPPLDSERGCPALVSNRHRVRSWIDSEPRGPTSKPVRPTPGIELAPGLAIDAKSSSKFAICGRRRAPEVGEHFADRTSFDETAGPGREKSPPLLPRGRR